MGTVCYAHKEKNCFCTFFYKDVALIGHIKYIQRSSFNKFIQTTQDICGSGYANRIALWSVKKPSATIYYSSWNSSHALNSIIGMSTNHVHPFDLYGFQQFQEMTPQSLKQALWIYISVDNFKEIYAREF